MKRLGKTSIDIKTRAMTLSHRTSKGGSPFFRIQFSTKILKYNFFLPLLTDYC